MPRFITASILALTLCAAVPAFAKSSSKFETTLSAPITSAVKVEVVLGDDLAHRANNLPKDRRDRGFSRGLNDAFGGNGFYGERDLNRLTERLQKRLEKRLEKEGVATDPGADTVLRLVITDARPNRPTFRQLSKDVSLSYQSFGIGGAAFEGEIIAAGGESLGDLSYAWYEDSIRDAAYSGTWTDAHRAIDLFARKTAKTLIN